MTTNQSTISTLRFDPHMHKRRSIRLKGYDYSSEGLYFLTLSCLGKKHLFGHIQNGRMCLNAFGSIAYEEWHRTPVIRPNISLGAFIIMPNHMHGIIKITSSANPSNIDSIGKFKSPSQTIGAIIRGYKGATTKRIKELIYSEKGDSKKEGDSIRGNSDSEGRDSDSGIRENSELGGSYGRIAIRPNRCGRIAIRPNNRPHIDLNKSIWQRNYYEHIIRNETAFQNIANYINNNPEKWSKAKFKANG